MRNYSRTESIKGENIMNRKEFLQAAAGAAAAAALPTTVVGAAAATTLTAAACSAPQKKGPKRGVSLFSYTMEFQYRKTFEDILEHVADLAAPDQGYQMGVEILHGHVPDYPNPSTAWVDNWHKLVEKYNLFPAEFGTWTDSNRYFGRETTAKEELDALIIDIKLANLLGFDRIRSRYANASINGVPSLQPGGGARFPWMTAAMGNNAQAGYGGEPRLKATMLEVIKAALPTAEKYNVRITEEFQWDIKARQCAEMVEFIEKEKASPWYSINPDFAKFANLSYSGAPKKPVSEPKDLIPVLPYCGILHAKCGDIDENCEDKSTPFPEIIKILLDHSWDGYLITEYQGPKMFEGQSVNQVRRMSVQLRRLLGEA
jgi:sugar phosphate isomerase/epimerase